MTSKLEFEIADNAFDFILSAAENTKLGTPRGMKYGLLHLFAGIELLLKARLYEDDWTLIFSNKAKADQKALKAGDFHSVKFEDARDRLATDCNVTIDAQTYQHLDDLRKLRNRVQHFEIDVGTHLVQSLLATGTNFVIDFATEHLPDLIADRPGLMDKLHEHHRDFRAFGVERIKAIEAELATAATKIECPRCWQEALVVGDFDDPKCYFCSEEFDAEELAVENSESAKAEQCPTCGRETAALQIMGGNDGHMIWFCYGCGEDGPYSRCGRCDNLMWGDVTPCSSCMDELLSKDD